MHLAFGLVLLVAASASIAGLARRFRLSEPLVLTLAGMVGSYLWFVPTVEIHPEVVLLGLLPPLLYTAAINTSLIDFKANVRPIALLSVGLVLFTAFVVGTVVWLLLPVPYVVAVALGAVVAPPDAVAASAIARRTGMPRRIVTLLEGESLFNDATAIVTLRTAIAAFAGTVTLWQTSKDFLVAAGGGAAVGLAAAFLLGQLRRRMTDPVLDTSLSLIAPFAAYLPAEHIHGSGVIAVVTCGLILGHKAPIWQSAASRIAERTNWRTIQFLLESSVFLLIGLQVRTIVEGAWNSGLGHGQLLLACAGTLLATTLARPAWVFASVHGFRLVPHIRRSEPAPSWKHLAVVSWAGMRGVVTLAAVLLLPLDTPQLDVLKLLALVVVGGTLIVQGTSLPWLMRTLDLHGPSHAEDALQQAALLQKASEAGLRALEENVLPDTPPGVVDNLRHRVHKRAEASWERLGPIESEKTTPSWEYRRLRLLMLAAEREVVLTVRDAGKVDHEVLQSVMGVLDLEESMIDRFEEAEDDLRQERVAAATAGACRDLQDAPAVREPDHAGYCQECLDEGLAWVHLRMCLDCGHIACCDSSPGTHATKHFRATTHPVMRSVEPGEEWRWCYLHNLLG